METIKKRRIPEAYHVSPKLDMPEIKKITISRKNVEKVFRDEVEESKYRLDSSDKNYKSEFFESIKNF